MAFSARIDNITIDGENVSLEKTQGEHPLPVAASGSAVSWGTLAEFKAALIEAEDRIQNDLYLVRVAKAYKADPTLGATFRTVAMASPAAIIDLTGLGSTITI